MPTKRRTKPYNYKCKVYVTRADLENRYGVSVFHYKHPEYDDRYEIVECELKPLKIVGKRDA